VASSESSKAVTASIEPGHKKPYAPPKLTRIKLRPEEAVLGNCKASGAGPGSPALCKLCGWETGS
jgi:hypothetical protein